MDVGKVYRKSTIRIVNYCKVYVYSKARKYIFRTHMNWKWITKTLTKPMEGGDNRIHTYNQYHGCWYPGSKSGEVINGHGVYRVILQYPGPKLV